MTDEEPHLVSIRDNLGTIALMEAVYLAAETGGTADPSLEAMSARLTIEGIER